MKLVTYNVHYGFGRDGINDLDRICEEIDGADIVALQEVERNWPRSGMADQVAAIAKRLPHHWVAYGPNLDLHSPGAFPGEVDTARRQFGNAIFSNRPILSQVNLALPRPTGRHQTMQRGALEVVVDTKIGPVRVYCTHLDYLSPRTRSAQLQTIADRHINSRNGGGPWAGVHAVADEWLVGDEAAATPHAIVLGDLNISTQSSEYDRALEMLCEFVDAWHVSGNKTVGATKDGDRIDHAFVTPAVAARLSSAWVDEAAKGSDHFPAWFGFDL
ncbi:MAG: hydrolase [Acidimicrobiia bacterium]|nr:hydrolase [Acidimicrobiia bacterium]